MLLAAGDRLGPYQIVSLVGAGGMGEVYRARDTRLDRTVAIKILASELDTPSAHEQFDREARAISSLQGPHLCALYDVGTKNSRAYLVMEYLDGETLADRLARGRLPLKRVFEYAIQIAEALDHVHRQGLIHRDLKPGNVMLTKSGVKLLDFGLAKIARNPAWLALSGPDQTHTLTAAGPLMGTCHYIAPELLAGQKPDIRCDIFAFGALLYEMITGRRAFEGKTQAVTIANILENEPPPMAAETEPPGSALAALDHLIRTCLLKDPDERRQTAHDILLELRWLAETDTRVEAARPAARRSFPLAAILGGLLVIAAILVLALLLNRPSFQKAQLTRSSILPPERATFTGNSVPAISPDGAHLAFAASSDGKTLLWVRDLDSASARPLPGTENAFDPFWSPDSREVAFFADGKLRKVKPSGGPSVVLCDTAQSRGGTWNRAGTILFTPSTTSVIHRVSAQGGKPAPVTSLDDAEGEVSHRWPWFLPDGRHFLFVSRNSQPGRTAIFIGDLDSPERQRLRTVASNAVYAPPGFVLFVHEHTLMAESFDAAHLRASGDPVPIAEQVDLITGNVQGNFSVSETGAVAFYSATGDRGNSQLTWFDRSGKKISTVGEPGNFIKPVVSPDGTRLAVDRLEQQSGSYDVWGYDLARGSPTRLTFDGRQDGYPVWSPDGNSIAFASNRAGHYQLYRKAVGSSGQEEVLLESAPDKFPSDWSRDGRYLIFYQIDPKTKYDLWALPMTGDRKPFPLLTSEFNEHRATLSPDGKWLAYTSDETTRDEIYVQSFPKLGNKWRVSANGGTRPVWSRDGKELFYIAADRKLMACGVKAGEKIETTAPTPLFETRPVLTRFYDISPDGRRFLFVDPIPDPPTAPVNLIVNFTAALKN